MFLCIVTKKSKLFTAQNAKFKRTAAAAAAASDAAATASAAVAAAARANTLAADAPH